MRITYVQYTTTERVMATHTLRRREQYEKRPDVCQASVRSI